MDFLTNVMIVFSLPAAIFILHFLLFHAKLTVMDVKKLSEDMAKKRLNELIDLDDWSDDVKIVVCLSCCTKVHVLDKLKQKQRKQWL